MQDFFVIANALMYLATFIFYYIKNGRKFDIGCLILIIYTISSLSSIYFYFNSRRDFSNITFLPFLYLYIVFMIIFIPFTLIKYDSLKEIKFGNSIKSIDIISIVIILFSVELFLENLNLLIRQSSGNSITESIGYLYDSGDKMDKYYSWIGSKFNMLNKYLSDIIPFLLFCQLSFKKKKWIFIVGLAIATLNTPLNAYINASRVSIVRNILYLIFLFFLFKNVIDEKIVNKIKIFGGTSILFLLLLVAYITIDRFIYSNINDDIDMMTWISLYTGEGFLNFNVDVWNMTVFTQGDYSFSFFKYIFGLDTFLTDDAKRLFWEPQTHIQLNIFYTFIGDIFIDLGLIGTVIYFSILSFVTKRFILFNNNSCEFYKILIIALIGKILMFGFTYYVYQTFLAQTLLMASLIIYLFLKLSYSKNV